MAETALTEDQKIDIRIIEEVFDHIWLRSPSSIDYPMEDWGLDHMLNNGWERIEKNQVRCPAMGNVPEYTKSIDDAFDVIRHMLELGFPLTLKAYDNQTWSAYFGNDHDTKDYDSEPARVICRAALQVLEKMPSHDRQ